MQMKIIFTLDMDIRFDIRKVKEKPSSFSTIENLFSICITKVF